MGQLLVVAAINIAVSLLAAYLFAPEGQDITQEGPKLDDLNVTSSAYGKNINLAYGTARLNGNIIWSPGIEEVAETTTQEQGKGGGGGSVTQTTYTYFGTFALAIAEGQADRILRIWADNKLIWDATGPSPEEVAAGGPALANILIQKSTQGNRKYAFKFYNGAPTQEIDPLMQADIDGKFGAGSTPAYNDLVYLIADRWPLADFGNRIPNITVEITFNGTASLPFLALTELPSHDVPGSVAGGSAGHGMFLDPDTNLLYFIKNNPNGVGVANAFTMEDINIMTEPSSLGTHSMIVAPKSGTVFGQHGSANFEEMRAYNVFTDTFLGASTFTFGNGIWPAVIEAEFPGTPIPSATFLVVSRKSILDDGAFSWIRMTGPGAFQLLGSDTSPATRSLDGGPAIGNWFNQEAYVIMENNTNVEIYRFRVVPDIGIFGADAKIEHDLVVSATKASLGFAAAPITGWVLLPNENAIILGTGIPQAGSMVKFDLDDWSVIASTQLFGTSAPNNFAYNGYWSTCGDNTTNNGLYYTVDTDTLEVIETFDADVPFPGQNWSAQRSCVFDPRSDTITFSRVFGSNPASNRVVRVFLGRGTGAGVPLSDVVTDICAKAGLSAADIDVTDLTTDTLRGYVVSRTGAYRAALEPLQKAFLFDGVESDWQLKFVKRGGSPVLTIAEDDIGRLSNDPEKEIIEEKRVQEVELPERVIVGYSDASREYEPGTAMDKRIAEPRPTQYSRSELKIDFPIVMTPTEAKQLASQALFSVWEERLGLDSSLPWRYIRLDPTDVASMIYRGETRQIRMGEIEVGADLSLDFTATQEDVSTYISTLTGDGGAGFVPTIPFGGLPTKWLPMNLPLLFATHATAGTSNRVYYAFAGYEAGWPGASLFQSIDLGASYSQISAFNIEAAWGVVATTIPDLWDPDGLAYSRKSGGAGGFTWDDVTTIDVKTINEPDRWVTSTDTEVLNGANAAAVIKSDGTVEIIQFVTVTTVDQNTVRLSRLLRGRRGTEDYGIGHAPGATIVLLEQGRVNSWRNALSLVNISTLYRPVTAATRIEDSPQTAFIANGEDLRPYSVVNIASSRAGGNVTLTWDRRTRFNGELLDGTGTVPLNEVTEEYEVEYYLQGEATPFLTRTGLTSPTDTLLAAEFSAAVPIGVDQLLFTNWNFERQATNGVFPDSWVDVPANSGNWRVESGTVGSITGPPAGGGSNYAVITTDNTTSDLARMVTSKKWSFIDDFFQTPTLLDAGTATIDLDVQTSNPNSSVKGTEVELRIFDASDTLIQTITSGRITGTPGTWINTTVLATTLTAGARTFEVRVTADNNAGLSFDECTGAVDHILIELNGMGTVIPALDVKIYQVSDAVGRGKATRQRV